ncbi:hypothetical protein N0M98_28295 [Paenibacillus doosanensis]|uniref:Uncharacterized protein n=1 Tax=Paenibacillus konkukensis TaxID=2020716 RepID=A0ABY4RIN5_9BACL|nr:MULTISPECIES: hypothetical protein [Paenibacillus]MCS7464016.1 hypothetical protein [Paenibacillus doosanensis]UQZ81388.1 hypothetical protein SK3146_00544 [Paenibacillus konkukensis]
MLTYAYDVQNVELQESVNGEDVEFRIRLIGDASLDERMRNIQKDFEQNDVLTDVMSYAFKNRTYQFIVRKDFYVDFVLSLMKYRILLRVEWDQ